MSSIPSCGIDFGTSNSTVAVSTMGNSQLVLLEDGKTTLPSAMFFRSGSSPLFGRAAIDAYTGGDEGRLMRGLKKILGTSLMDEKTQVGNRFVGFTEILQNFIAHLKARAEEDAGTSIDHVVIGRPVHFHDDDGDADAKSQATLEEIARMAGFGHIDFLYEPIAAAFAHEARIEEETISLVVDLGGGTSDFTVIKIGRDKISKTDRSDDILAAAGVRVGGTTFDYRFSLQSFMPELGMGSQYRDLYEREKLHYAPAGVYRQLSDWAFVNHAQTRKAIAETMDLKRRALAPDKFERLLKLQQNHLGHALLGEVEKAKIMLTDLPRCETRLSELDEDFVVSSERTAFEDSIAADVERIFRSIETCLSLAQVKSEDIGLVILTGGSTELPLVNRMVRNAFPHAAISQDNKMDSVGLGLAYRARALYRQ